jgi:hypothetical protein
LNLEYFISFTFIFVMFSEFCLFRGVYVAGVVYRAAMRIMTGVGDLIQRNEDDRTGRLLGDRTIRILSDVVCDLHRARGDDEREFLN